MGYFQPGATVLRREVLHGAPWVVTPSRVVVDEPDLLVVFLVPGTRFGYPPHPWPHEKQLAGNATWRGHGKLQMHRPDDAYSVDLYWEGPSRRFHGWYLNLQDPYRRTPLGFDTLDHELDYWAPADGPWVERDREDFERQVVEGKYSAELAERVRRQGKEIEAMLTAGTTWWDPAWASWEPDPDWPVPTLPDGWEDYPQP
ncbi:DUF402 domain-containing protein [Umezawaea endophytica]|uniref:DUF402 domain-containing protein n=1 Tax=Umezawaea endophytica TaxID=1654476 RepID=A0A9X2VHD1_9PSEU|nr:DUF402 domain-containing protein [Umezawaea endophytica]MCS7476154.1 DUF402 domain-containing protein [Umezawaea endophytica]